MKYCLSAILGIMCTTAAIITPATTSLADCTVHSSWIYLEIIKEDTLEEILQIKFCKVLSFKRDVVLSKMLPLQKLDDTQKYISVQQESGSTSWTQYERSINLFFKTQDLSSVRFVDT